MSNNRPPSLEFASVARRFCALIDARAAHSAASMIRELGALLPELLFRASALPAFGTSEAPLLAPAPDHLEAWTSLSDSLNELLGEYDLYWEVFDPAAKSEDDPISATLSDALADIYLDLVGGLEVLDDAQVSPAAVTDWRFRYESHWGQHAASALRAVHSWNFGHDLAVDA